MLNAIYHYNLVDNHSEVQNINAYIITILIGDMV